MTRRYGIAVLGTLAFVMIGIYFFMARVQAHNPLERYEAALRLDRTGGATPEKTLRFFVAVLRAHDVQRAHEYFVLDHSLSRQRWLERLMDLEKKNLLDIMANDIEAHARRAPSAYPYDAQFEIMNSDGTVGALIDLEFNPLSGVWKLERF